MQSHASTRFTVESYVSGGCNFGLAIDWADQKHVWWCLQAVGSEKRESGEVKHSPETMEAWVGQLWSDRSGTGAIPGSCGLHAEKV